MSRIKIDLVLGDHGSVEYIQPAMRFLKSFDLRVVADSSGAAPAALEQYGIAYEKTDTMDLKLRRMALVLCGAAGKAQGLWKSAMRLAEGTHTTAWLGDFYGSGCESQLSDFTPRLFAAFDWDSAKQFSVSHPKSSVCVVGNPAFDTITRYDRAAERVRVREKIGVSEGDIVALYEASSIGQFDIRESFTVLRMWMDTQPNAKLAIAFHPADAKLRSKELRGLTEELRGSFGSRFIDSEHLRGLPNSFGADMFVTDYSTGGVKACLSGIPTFFIMLDSARAYQHSRGMKPPYFPVLDDRYMRSPAVLISREDQWQRLREEHLNDVRTRISASLGQSRFQPLIDGGCTGRFESFVRQALVQ